jgi:hypothetical protein
MKNYPQTSYDIIGDIHGHCDALEALLHKLGYEKNKGIYAHPERKVVFLGDYIDRGPKIVQTVALVRGMVEAGNALAIMGNHEYNRICYETPHPRKPDLSLRIHNEKNESQTRATTQQYAAVPDQLKSDIEWFKTLPFALDLGGVRCVHACWSSKCLDVLKFKTLQDLDFLVKTATRPTPEHPSPEYDAIETVLKGKEISLPHGHFVQDKEGHQRDKMRTRWWMPFCGKTYRDISIPYDPSASTDLVAAKNEEPYPENLPPVFVGHYWFTDSRPAPLAPNIACLDYSVAKGGFLCAYRWDGETILDPEKFIF